MFGLAFELQLSGHLMQVFEVGAHIGHFLKILLDPLFGLGTANSAFSELFNLGLKLEVAMVHHLAYLCLNFL